MTRKEKAQARWLPQGTVAAPRHPLGSGCGRQDMSAAELLDTAASMKGSGWGGGSCHSPVIRERSPQLPASLSSSFISQAAFAAWSPREGPWSHHPLTSNSGCGQPPEAPSDSCLTPGREQPPPSWKGLNSLLSSEHRRLSHCASRRPPWWQAGLINHSVNCWSGARAIVALLRVTKCF